MFVIAGEREKGEEGREGKGASSTLFSKSLRQLHGKNV